MVTFTSLSISGGLAIIVGIIILIWPRSLNIAVALWLIIQGILSFFSF
jgi:hypothetical protein